MLTELGRRSRRRLWLALPTLAIALVAQADDYSVETGSPEVPFTFAAGDIAIQDGTAINVAGPLLGLGANDELDAFSYGDDQPEPAGIENFVNFDFSVDRLSAGGGGIVTTEANGNGAAGDKFRIIAFRNGRTVGPQRLSDAPDHGLTAKSSGTTESEIDALGLVSGTQMPVFFSVSRAGSTTLTTLGPADIAYVQQPGVTPPTVYATAAQLGLQAGDNIDALCIRDRGALGQLDARDLVYVSLDRASPTRAATFAGGADGVLRVWPLPARIIYRNTQLDMAAGDELDAMTARDPGGSRGPGSVTRLPKDSTLVALVDKRLLRKGRVFRDGSSALALLSRRAKYLGRKRRVLAIRSRSSRQFGFGSLVRSGRRRTSIRYTIGLATRQGQVPGVSNFGCEFDVDATPGQIPQRFLYGGCTPTVNGLRAYCAADGANVGTPRDFPGADELEFTIALDPENGADVACRALDGDWVSLYSNPAYQPGSTLDCGFGASNLDAGAEVFVSDCSLSTDGAATWQPYLTEIDRCSQAVSDAASALGPDAGGSGSAPDTAAAVRAADAFLEVVYGTVPALDEKATPTADGLLLKLRDASLGPLPDFASAAAVQSRVAKAARQILKVRKAATKSRVNAQALLRKLAQATKALEDARDLMALGVVTHR